MSSGNLINLKTVLWFGIYKGATPAELLKKKNVEGIKYLAWMRSGGFKSPIPFHKDLHHALDQILRLNSAVFAECKPRFSESDYNVWLAEKRLEKMKAEKIKADEAQRKQKELAKFQEQQRNKDLEIKRQQAQYLQKKELERRHLNELKEARESAYSSEWGIW